MRFLPIVERELRVTSRHSGTHYIRLGAALVALVIGGWILLTARRESPRFLGTVLFVSLSIFAYVYCILVGLRTTADCLSQEKREGTLGLLFLTDLRGYDIVLGKLAATSVNALYGLLAMVPVMAIPLLLGGVTGGEFWRVVLCALNGLFFSLAAGMFASAINTDERRAMFTTLLIILVAVAGLPVLGALDAAWRDQSSPNPIFFVPSPGFAAFAAFDETQQMLGREKFNYYWGSVLCVHGMGWGLLWLACWIVPHSWRGRAESVAQVKRREWWHRVKYGAGAYRQSRRADMLAVNPVYWLTGRDRFRSWLLYLFLGGSGLLWLWGWAVWGKDYLNEVVYIMTALALHTVLKVRIASEACLQFAQDRRSGALELLLSTPLRVRQIVGGQLLGLLRQFLVPVLVVLGVDFVFLLAAPRHGGAGWVFLWLAGMGIFVADMVALAWVGMWVGLSTGQVSRATASAVFRIMTLPWIVFGILTTFLAMSNMMREFSRLFSRNEEVVALALWALVGLAVDLGFGLAARQALLTRFRATVPQKTRKRSAVDFLLSRDLPADR